MERAQSSEMEVILALLTQSHEIIYFEVTDIKRNEPVPIQKLCWVKKNGMVTE